jgi:hypothetical protein
VSERNDTFLLITAMLISFVCAGLWLAVGNVFFFLPLVTGIMFYRAIVSEH